jgi:hypothetical protein
MTSHEAITDLCQSEKIKAGLIWATQSLEALSGLPPARQAPILDVIQGLIGSVANEASIARRVGAEEWLAVERRIDRALVMIRSGVPQEATYHLARALSAATDRGQRAMRWLRDHELL